MAAKVSGNMRLERQFDKRYGEKTYNAVAIVSKLPLKNVQGSIIEKVVPPARRFIEATVGRLRI